MTGNDILEAVAAKVRIKLDRSLPIGSSDDLVEAGMDSFQLIQIVVELEAEYGLTFDDNQLVLDNLNTIEKISRNFLVDETGGRKA